MQGKVCALLVLGSRLGRICDVWLGVVALLVGGLIAFWTHGL